MGAFWQGLLRKARQLAAWGFTAGRQRQRIWQGLVEFEQLARLRPHLDDRGQALASGHGGFDSQLHRRCCSAGCPRFARFRAVVACQARFH